jgi:hypothetical protein
VGGQGRRPAVGQLEQAGFDAAMCAALAAEPVLAADETPVNVLAPGAPAPAAGQEEEDPEDGDRRAPGAPHVLVIRTPDERLTWLHLDSARNHGLRALDAIRCALEGNPGYRHSPHRPDARSRAPVNGHLRTVGHTGSPVPV